MGHVEIKLKEMMEDKGISKTKICKHCDIQRAQLNKYMNNDMDRVDLSILARFCAYLECEVHDLLEYKK